MLPLNDPPRPIAARTPHCAAQILPERRRLPNFATEPHLLIVVDWAGSVQGPQGFRCALKRMVLDPARPIVETVTSWAVGLTFGTSCPSLPVQLQ